VGQTLDRDPRTRIAHGQTDAIAAPFGLQLDTTAFGSVPDRVRGDVLQRLLEPVRVCTHFQILGHDRHVHPEVSASDRRAVSVDNAPEQFCNGHRLLDEITAAAFEPGEIEQVSHDCFQLAGLLIDDVEVALPRGFVGAEARHRERLHVPTNGRQRRHQLV
jgi:hypothetical protein